MERKNGRIRITPDEATETPWIYMGPARLRRNEDNPADTFLYFSANPMETKPWLVFDVGGHVQVKPTLPAGFVDIYGERPTGDAGTTELRGLQQFWDQQLGLWRDNLVPDWVSTEQQAAAQANFGAMGLTRLLPYRLTNGAEFVAFPDAKVRIEALPLYFQLPSRLVYDLGQQGAAIYQWQLKQAGIDVPTDEQVSFFGGPRLHTE